MFSKSGLGVIQGHWKRHHSIDGIQVHVGVLRSTLTTAVFCIVSEIKRDIGRKSLFFSYPTRL